MPLNDAAHDAGLTGITNNIGYISLHSASPATAANEISGGSPAYARQAVTWAAAATSSQDISGTLTFDVPAGTTIAAVGYWSAATAGTFYGGAPLSASESYASQGQFNLTSSKLDMTG